MIPREMSEKTRDWLGGSKDSAPPHLRRLRTCRLLLFTKAPSPTPPPRRPGAAAAAALTLQCPRWRAPPVAAATVVVVVVVAIKASAILIFAIRDERQT